MALEFLADPGYPKVEDVVEEGVGEGLRVCHFHDGGGVLCGEVV